MRTWTFGRKIGAAFALVVLLTLTMGGVGLYALEAVVQGKDRVIQNFGQNLIDAERLHAAVQTEVAEVRGFLLTKQERYARGTQEANQAFVKTLDELRARQTSPSRESLLSAIATAKAEYQSSVDQLIERRRRQDDFAPLVETFEQQLVPKFDVLSNQVQQLVADSVQAREDGRVSASNIASNAMTVLITVGFATALLALLGAVFLTRVLSRQIGSSVQNIRSSSAELQAVATQQASGAKEQATAMSEITTTIGELLATSRQIALSGQHVAQMAADSAESARSGETAVKKANDAVSSIKQQVDAIVQHMLSLGKKSQQIGAVIEIITELAEQTNILAINATIEAAGAGEAGRRFSVVGDEVRKLADRVGGSTKEIRNLIEEVRSAVNATVMATETGSKTVEAGAQRFQDVQACFANIGKLVTSTMEAGREIELSTKQQATAVEQVNVAISNVAQATRETESGSQQTLQTSNQLTFLSDGLARLVQAERALA